MTLEPANSAKNNVGIAKSTKNGTKITFTANPTDKDTTVRVYYMDQVATVTVSAVKTN